MAEDPDVLSVTLSLNPRRIWLTLPLEVPGFGTLPMVLDTGSPVSAISEGTLRNLEESGSLIETGKRFRNTPAYALVGASIGSHPLDNLEIYVSARVTEVGAEGLLGLDFLFRFREIHFDVETMRLTLTH